MSSRLNARCRHAIVLSCKRPKGKGKSGSISPKGKGKSGSIIEDNLFSKGKTADERENER